MESAQTSRDDYYIITQKDDRTLRVLNKITGEYKDVTPTVNPLNPTGEAFDCTNFTRGTYKLNACATEKLPILTTCYTTSGGLNNNLWGFM